MFYKKWNDDSDAEGQRSDIYLTLYRKIGDTGTIESVSDGYQWTKCDNNSLYDWKATFEALPKYVTASMKNSDTSITANIGEKITYYASESMKIQGNYVISYQDPTEFNTNGDTTAFADNAVKDKTLNGGRIINTLTESMTVSGEKIWLNTPEGTKKNLTNIPADKISLTLERKSGTADYTTVKDSSGNPIKASITTDTSSPYSTDSPDFSYTFGDNTLPKYDEQGRRYTYKVIESFTSDPVIEKLIYPDDSTDDTNFTLKNTYALVNKSPTIYFNLDIHKNFVWAGNTISAYYPTATFDVYRFAPDSTAYNASSFDNDSLSAGTKVAGGLSINTNGGEATVSDLPIYAPNAMKYKYLVVETSSINDYKTTAGTTVNPTTETKYVLITPPDYTAIDAERVSDAYYVNTYNGTEYVKIAGTKEWLNDYGSEYERPKLTDAANALPLIITRTASGIATPEKITDKCTIAWTTGSTNNEWKYTITPSSDNNKIYFTKYATNGQPYTYTVTEDSNNAECIKKGYYYPENNGKSSTGITTGDTITEPAIKNDFGISFTVKKYWDDNLNSALQRPNSINIKLQYSTDTGTSKAWADCTSSLINNVSTYVFAPTVSVTDVGANNKAAYWYYTFKNLPKYDKNKNSIYYRAIETQVGDNSTNLNTDTSTKETNPQYGSYKVTHINNDTFTSTEIDNKLDSKSLTVKKNWVDNSNYYKVRPDSLKVYLQRKAGENGTWGYVKIVGNTTDTDADYVSLTLTGKADTWSGSFQGLPSCDAAGVTYYYQAVETAPTSSTSTVTNPSYQSADPVTSDTVCTLTNTLDTASNQYRTYLVKKIWDDADNKDGGRPTTVNVQLQYSATPTNANSWSSVGSQVTLNGRSTDETTTEYVIGNWSYKWLKLPKYDKSGKELAYRAVEITDTDKSGYIYGTNGSYKVAYKPTYTYFDSEDGEAAATPITASTLRTDIKNTHTPNTASLTLTKSWSGDTILNSIARPASVYAKLEYSTDSGNTWNIPNNTADPWKSITPVKEIMAGTNPAWTVSWTGLPWIISNNHVKYKAVECDSTGRLSSATDNTMSKGYTATESTPAATYTAVSGIPQSNEAYTETITNTASTVSATVNKTWSDTYELYKGITTVKFHLWYRTDSASAWTDTSLTNDVNVTASMSGTFTGLPKYTSDNKLIYYTISEDSYTAASGTVNASYSGSGESKYTAGSIGAYLITASTSADTSGNYTSVISNTLVTRPAFVRKIWDDNSNQDGYRPKSVTIALTGTEGSNTVIAPLSHTLTLDGTADTVPSTAGTGYELPPTGDNTWNGEWEKLPLKNINGTVIKYSVAETAFVEKSGSTTTAISAASFNAVSSDTGSVYSITYGNTADGTAADKAVSVTNTHTPETVSFTAAKTWDDEKDVSGGSNSLIDTLRLAWKKLTRPAQITLDLQSSTDGTNWADVVAVSGKYINPATVTPTDRLIDTAWDYTWSNLPKYINGSQIRYRVKETAVNGYNSNGDLISSNAGALENSLDTTTFSFTKNWVDSGNSTRRPDNITFRLQYSNDNGTSWTDYQPAENTYADIPVNVNKTDSTQTYTLFGLPVKDSSGKSLKYRVYEHKIGTSDVAYSTTNDPASKGSAEGYDVVNDFTADTTTNTLNVTQLTVTKKWDDDSNAYGTRPDSIGLNIYQNGSLTPFKTIQGTDIVWSKSGNIWTYTVNNLPAKDSNGTAYTYSLSEANNPAGYTSSVNNYEITNTYDTTLVKTGSLKAVKRLTPEAAALNDAKAKVFTFKVTITKKNGVSYPYSGAFKLYKLVKNSITGVETSSKILPESPQTSFNTTSGEIQLKADQYFIIDGIPVGFTYRIDEISAADLMVSVSSNATGTIAEGTDPVVCEYTNGVIPPQPVSPSTPSTPSTPSEPETPVTPKTPKKPKVPVNPLNPNWNPPVPLDPAKPYDDTYKPVDPNHYPGIVYNSTGDVIREAAEGFDNKGGLVFDKEYKGALYDANGKMVRGARRGYNVDGTRAATGDTSALGLWLILMLSSGGAVIWLRRRRRHKN